MLLAALAWAATASAQETANRFTELAARATAAREANDNAGAIALYRQALEVNRNWAAGWWMMGSLHYDAGQFVEGRDALRHLVQLTPKAGVAWALLGLCDYEAGGYTDALEEIRRGLSLGIGEQPQMTLVLKFHEAALLTRAGRFDEAVRNYSSFVPGKVTDEQVLVGLGLAQLRRPATPGEVKPEDREFLLSTGRAFGALLTGDNAAAKTLYEDLVTRYPASANAHYAYGYLLFATDADLALGEWGRALALDESHAGSHAMTAWVLALRNENAAALEHARQALAKDPNLTIARITAGRLTVAKGRVAQGIADLERAVKEDAANLEAHLALATAYSTAGRKADARRERDLSVKLQGNASAAAQP